MEMYISKHSLEEKLNMADPFNPNSIDWESKSTLEKGMAHVVAVSCDKAPYEVLDMTIWFPPES